LHHDKDIPAIEARPDSQADCPVQPSDPITFSHLHAQPEQVIQATAVVLDKDASGTCRPGRALLDACSQVNLINEEFAQKLRLRHEKFNMGIRSFGDTLQPSNRVSQIVTSQWSSVSSATSRISQTLILTSL